MEELLKAILEDNRAEVSALMRNDPILAILQIQEPRLYETGIVHWIYAGDTALHLAAAGHRVEIVRLLLTAGANPNSAKNHRQSSPFHYASDGFINRSDWNESHQVQTIHLLLDAGAKITAQDKNGASALHRAVRTRCSAAVKFLLEHGADPKLKNKPGSTPFHLAVQNTGRGGSGADIAKAAQRQIIHHFLAHGVSPETKDATGKSVLDSTRSQSIKNLLSNLTAP